MAAEMVDGQMGENSKMSEPKPRRVSLSANPRIALVVSVMGVAASALTLPHASHRELSVALWTGFGLGLPILLPMKWILHRRKAFCVDYYTSTWEERNSKGMQWTIMLHNLPLVILDMWISIPLHEHHLLGYVGLPIYCALVILIYPEQKAIYEAAKARLQEAERQ